jgi:hypothetical protein
VGSAGSAAAVRVARLSAGRTDMRGAGFHAWVGGWGGWGEDKLVAGSTKGRRRKRWK